MRNRARGEKIGMAAGSDGTIRGLCPTWPLLIMMILFFFFSFRSPMEGGREGSIADDPKEWATDTNDFFRRHISFGGRCLRVAAVASSRSRSGTRADKISLQGQADARKKKLL